MVHLICQTRAGTAYKECPLAAPAKSEMQIEADRCVTIFFPFLRAQFTSNP